MSEPRLVAPTLASLGLSTARPLILVDVDEVLGLFMQGFGDYVAARGYEMRIDKFALFQNVYPIGSSQHITMEDGKALFDGFFAGHCHEIEPAPGAIAALNRLANHAEILILSNAPAPAQTLRAQWLQTHGMPHPLILNTGPKGPVAAGLTTQTPHPTAFVDDLLHNLDSVADHSPTTATFQHIADLRLRPYAPRSDRHIRIDDWAELGEAIEAAILSPAKRYGIHTTPRLG